MSSSRQLASRLALIAGGIFSALVLLELVLRFAGSLLSSNLPKPSHAPLRILCLGESTTAPTHPLDYSWPEQLQGLLDASLGPGAVLVINAGVPATTTNVIMARLPGLLAIYHPRVVISMMGINDYAWYDAAPKHNLMARTFFNLRVVRAMRYIYHGLPFAFSSPRDTYADTDKRWIAAAQEATRLCQRGEFTKARLILTPFLKSPKTFWRIEAVALTLLAYDQPRASRQEELLSAISPPEVPKYWFHWRRLEYEQRYRAAETYIRGVIRRSPHAVPAQEMLFETLGQEGKGPRWQKGKSGFNDIYAPPEVLIPLDTLVADDYIGLHHEAQRGLKKLSAEFPHDIFIHFEAITIALKNGNTPFADRQMGIITGWQSFEFEKLPSASDVTERNYQKLFKTLGQRGIHLIAMQYPLRDPRQLQAMLEPHRDIPIISNRGNFEKALQRLSYRHLFIDRFAGDFGHCTARGNALIAANVLAELWREKLLSQRKDSYGK